MLLKLFVTQIQPFITNNLVLIIHKNDVTIHDTDLAVCNTASIAYKLHLNLIISFRFSRRITPQMQKS